MHQQQLSEKRAKDRATLRRTHNLKWHGHRLAQEIEDAVQHVFLECYRERGALDKVEAGRAGGFRAFLVGVM